MPENQAFEKSIDRKSAKNLSIEPALYLFGNFHFSKIRIAVRGAGGY